MSTQPNTPVTLLRSQSTLPLDTPARAARLPHPQTRGWKRLLEDASSRTTESEEYRAELRRHLQAAERLASKRRIVCDRLELLRDVTADWGDRVKLLEEIARNGVDYEKEEHLADVLLRQLADLRSSVVIAASETVKKLAEEGILNDVDAAKLFLGAGKGVEVTKKVMMEARWAAALGALEGKNAQQVGQAVMDMVKEGGKRGRKLAIVAMMELVNKAEDVKEVREYVKSSLESGGIDREVDVREATRRLKTAFQEKFGKDECDTLLKEIGGEVEKRLRIGEGKKGIGSKNMLNKGKRGGGFKEFMRRQREAAKMKKEEEAPRTMMGKENVAQTLPV